MDKKSTILIADDDPYVLESVSKLLIESGHHVISCCSGEEAVVQALRNDVAMILTDIKMPGISGIELLDKIHVIYPRMPVILMTGYAELDIAIDAIKRGAFDFIIKPYNPDGVST